MLRKIICNIKKISVDVAIVTQGHNFSDVGKANDKHGRYPTVFCVIIYCCIAWLNM